MVHPDVQVHHHPGCVNVTGPQPAEPPWGWGRVQVWGSLLRLGACWWDPLPSTASPGVEEWERCGQECPFDKLP